MLCLSSFAQNNEIIRLYQSKAPGSENWTQKETEITDLFGNERYIMNVVDPTLTVYRPVESRNTGAAMVVCPGGGYRMLSIDSEGTNVAQWLASHGITAFVLRYRLVNTGDSPDEIKANIMNMFTAVEGSGDAQVKAREKMNLVAKESDMVRKMAGDDGRKAIEYVRKNADKYGIDPEKIGIIGFSAGSGVCLEVVSITQMRADQILWLLSMEAGRKASHQLMLLLCSPVHLNMMSVPARQDLISTNFGVTTIYPQKFITLPIAVTAMV